MSDDKDIEQVAKTYGFRPSSYSDSSTPVQLSVTDPSRGLRKGRAAGYGTAGAVLGAVLGDTAGRRIGPMLGVPENVGATAGSLLGLTAGGAAGGAHGWYNAPKQLMLSAQQPQAEEATKQAMLDVYGFKKTADVMRDEANAISMLPFGSSYIGYQRGKPHGDGTEGALRGFGGGMLGMGLGGAAGAKAFGLPGAIAGGSLGNIYGTHFATRSMLPQVRAEAERGAQAPQAQAAPPEAPKQASYDVFGFRTKEALAAPGLLGRMGGAIRGMGSAVHGAGQMAAKDYGLLNSAGTAARTFGHELMGTQAGRRAAGVGLGLGAAGVTAAGAAGYNALRRPNSATPAQQPLQR